MNNKEAKKLVEDTFNKIKSAKSINALCKIIKENKHLCKNKMKEDTYPALELKLEGSDIEDLKRSGYITKGCLLSIDLSNRKLSPLEKLLYSIIWKNGDLKKERHIIEGVLGGKKIKKKTSGLVFFQFGKYLADRNEPIIDQHVLRACSLFSGMANGKVEDITLLREKESVGTDDDIDLIEAYKEWLVSEDLQKLHDQDNYTFHIDKVLFALGKSIKQSKKKNRKQTAKKY